MRLSPLLLAFSLLSALACGAPLTGDWEGDCNAGTVVYTLSFTEVTENAEASTQNTTGEWRVYTGNGAITSDGTTDTAAATAIECLSEACTNSEDPYTAGQFMFEILPATGLIARLKGALDEESGHATGACYVQDVDGLVYTGTFDLAPGTE